LQRFNEKTDPFAEISGGVIIMWRNMEMHAIMKNRVYAGRRKEQSKELII